MCVVVFAYVISEECCVPGNVLEISCLHPFPGLSVPHFSSPIEICKGAIRTAGNLWLWLKRLCHKLYSRERKNILDVLTSKIIVLTVARALFIGTVSQTETVEWTFSFSRRYWRKTCVREVYVDYMDSQFSNFTIEYLREKEKVRETVFTCSVFTVHMGNRSNLFSKIFETRKWSQGVSLSTACFILVLSDVFILFLNIFKF